MKFSTSLFSQILQVLPRTTFLRLVHQHGAERHAKGFSSWDQFVAMLFCQLAQANPSLPKRGSRRTLVSFNEGHKWAILSFGWRV